MTYNLSGVQNSTNPGQLMAEVNILSGNIFFGGFLIILFFIILWRTKDYNFENGLLTASFICFGLSLILRIAGLVNFWFVIGFLTMLAFSLFGVIVIRKQ